jgi:hypothetical protein
MTVNNKRTGDYNKRTGPYICSICNKKFTRKWTTQRHNRDVHVNQSQIYDRLNNLIPNLPLLSPEDISDTKGGIGDFHTNVKDLNNNDVIHDPFNIKKTNRINFGSDDEIFDEEIGKLGPMLAELNKCLLKYPHDKRDLIYKWMVMRSLSSHDPSNTLKENLYFFKNIEYANEIRDCISSCCNIPTDMANEFLRRSILSKHKYKYKSDVGDTDQLPKK